MAGATQIIANPAPQGSQVNSDALCLAGDNLVVSALTLDDLQKVQSALILGWAGRQYPNALVIEGSASYGLALIWDEDAIYVVPMPFYTVQQLKTEISDIATATLILANAIAASNVGWQTQRIFTGTSFESLQRLLNEIREGLPGNQLIVGGIDAYQGAAQQILNELSYWGITGSQALKASIGAGALIYLQSMSVALDGQQLPVISGDIRLYGSMLADCNLTLATDQIYTGNEITVSIGTKTWRFLVEEDAYDAKSKQQTIWGRSPMAQYYEPLATKQEYRFANRLASHIASEVTPGEVDWQIDDWVVPLYRKEAYPLEVIQELAAAAGAVVRCDDKIHVVYPYWDDAPVDTLDHALSLSRERKVREYDGAKVTYGQEASLAIEADKPTVRPGEWVTVKVYCAAAYTFTCNADVYTRSGRGLEGIVEEELLFESDSGVALSKPCVEVISADCTVEGNIAYGNGDCRFGHVKYKTVYDEWLITNYSEGKKLVCSVATEGTVTVTEGSRLYEVTDSLTADSYIARRRAEKEMYDHLGLYTVKAQLPFDESLCPVEGVCVDTPWGRGVVVSNSVKWSANPLKIINEVEVMLWPA